MMGSRVSIGLGDRTRIFGGLNAGGLFVLLALRKECMQTSHGPIYTHRPSTSAQINNYKCM
ncbi:hypothetical protein RSAG8_02376, partial [Rhizoctonia solani AG-8 WAC10335]